MIFGARTKIDRAYVEENLELVAKIRKIERETLVGWESLIMSGIQSRSYGDVIINWAQKQAYIGLGIAISVAAELGIDSCPMEGFNASEFDRILGLKEQHLTATVLLPIGYRANDDPYIQLPKVRLPKNEFLIRI